MSGKVGSITTGIIADGLVFNMDPANRASYPKTGTTVTDTIGNQVGTLSSSPIFDPSEGEGVFDYDGTDNIDIPITSILQIINNFTYSFWVKTSGGAGSNSEGTFISNQFSWQTSGYVIGTYSGKIQVFGSDGSSVYYDASTMRGIGDNNITDNQWHHIAVKFASGVTKVYIDGSLPTNGSGEFTSGATSISYDNTTIFRIGQAATGGNYGHIGKIGPCQVYNRALSASEILHNYNTLKGRFS